MLDRKSEQLTTRNAENLVKDTNLTQCNALELGKLRGQFHCGIETPLIQRQKTVMLAASRINPNIYFVNSTHDNEISALEDELCPVDSEKAQICPSVVGYNEYTSDFRTAMKEIMHWGGPKTLSADKLEIQTGRDDYRSVMLLNSLKDSRFGYMFGATIERAANDEKLSHLSKQQLETIHMEFIGYHEAAHTTSKNRIVANTAYITSDIRSKIEGRGAEDSGILKGELAEESLKKLFRMTAPELHSDISSYMFAIKYLPEDGKVTAEDIKTYYTHIADRRAERAKKGFIRHDSSQALLEAISRCDPATVREMSNEQILKASEEFVRENFVGTIDNRLDTILEEHKKAEQTVTDMNRA